MAQPAQIAVEEGAQVVHAVFEHRQPVDAGAEGEALPYIGIEPAIGDHFGVDHARAEQLHPMIGAAEHAPALLHMEADIDLGRRLGEREIGGPQPQDDVVALEKALRKVSSVHLRWPRVMPRSITSPSTWWNIGVWVASLSDR